MTQNNINQDFQFKTSSTEIIIKDDFLIKESLYYTLVLVLTSVTLVEIIGISKTLGLRMVTCMIQKL